MTTDDNPLRLDLPKISIPCPLDEIPPPPKPSLSALTYQAARSCLTAAVMAWAVAAVLVVLGIAFVRWLGPALGAW